MVVGDCRGVVGNLGQDGGQAGETPEGSSNKTSELDKAIKTTVYRFGVAVPATLLCTYLIYGESFTKSGLFLGLDLAWTSVTYYWQVNRCHKRRVNGQYSSYYSLCLERDRFEVWWHELDSNKQVITAIAFLGGTALLLFLRWWYSDAISPLLS